MKISELSQLLLLDLFEVEMSVGIFAQLASIKLA